MLYAIISQDVENSLPLRAKARPSHLARLEQLQNEDRLILAGPHPAIDPVIDSNNPGNSPGEAGFTGSLVVAEFSSLSDAQTWADNDPYMQTGVYQKVTVKPFKQIFPVT